MYQTPEKINYLLFRMGSGTQATFAAVIFQTGGIFESGGISLLFTKKYVLSKYSICSNMIILYSFLCYLEIGIGII